VTVSRNRIIAVLKPPVNVTALVIQAKAIVVAMTGNKSFPSPTPSLSSIEAQATALSNAETVAMSRVRGAADARNVQRAALFNALHTLKAYVQSVADADLANALAIIESAGFSVKQRTTRSKLEFQVTQGAGSGVADVAVKAVSKRAAYYWQCSADGKTWTSLPATLQAHTTVTGLTPGTKYFFRYATLTKTGESNWSQVVSLIIK
jgi:hypothetical protein